jgi:hypothetical protein
MATSIPTPEELNSMTDTEYKATENRARRMAGRQGLRLEKSRARDPWALGYGTYQLTDASTNTYHTSGLSYGYGLSLADVFAILTGQKK